MKISALLLGRTRPLGSLLAISITLALCFSLTFLNSCVQNSPQSAPLSDQSKCKIGTISTPESYEEVYRTLEQTHENQYALGAKNSVFIDQESISDALSGDSADLSESAPASVGDFSETNVQVDGIDEGDIVKNNGKNIFLISGRNIVIAEAAGEETREVSRIAIDSKKLSRDRLSESDSDLYPAEFYTPRELYVEGNILMVLYEYYPINIAALESDSAEYMPTTPSRSISEVALFDISNPSNPIFMETFGQDGGAFSSRLQNGILYIVSNYSVSSGSEEKDLSSYVPLTYGQNAAELLPLSDICILPDYNSTAYTVISSIDIQKAQRIDTQSVLGAGNSLYMSHDNLYLSLSSLTTIENKTYQDGSFTVTEFTDSFDTRIAKLSLDEGVIQYVADTLIPGSILNQFSLDEYHDHLRLVTTVDRIDYRTITDAQGDITDYESYKYAPTTNSLHVLDADLNEVGSITGLAEDERIYSARFEGEIGYFVTFRQVDPLFSVDLSNPQNPTIKSELKIPGFSTYMHPFSENRLFGIGMTADRSGRTEGLKMSMFDTSDPYNVTEKHVLNLEDYHSEALYDHNALIISAKHDLIGFPTDEGYSIYGYSDTTGFYLRANLKRSVDSSYSAQRGLYLDKHFYLCAEESISAYTLDSFKNAARITIEVEEPDHGNIQPFNDMMQVE